MTPSKLLRSSQSLNNMQSSVGRKAGVEDKSSCLSKSKSNLDKPLKRNRQLSSAFFQSISMRFTSHSANDAASSHPSSQVDLSQMRNEFENDDSCLSPLPHTSAQSSFKEHEDRVKMKSNNPLLRCWPRSKSCSSSLAIHVDDLSKPVPQASTNEKYLQDFKVNEMKTENMDENNEPFQVDESFEIIKDDIKTFESIKTKNSPHVLQYPSLSSPRHCIQHSQSKRRVRRQSIFRSNTTTVISEEYITKHNNHTDQSISSKTDTTVTTLIRSRSCRASNSKVIKRRNSEPSSIRQIVSKGNDKELLRSEVEEIQRRNAICESSPMERKQLLSVLRDYTMVKHLQSYSWL